VASTPDVGGTIPPLIRRHTWILFLSQACLSSAMSTAAQLGSLIVYSLSGTAALAGVPTALTGLTVATVGYPAGRFMDRRGRRPGLVLGFVVGITGALIMLFAVTHRTLPVYLFGGMILAVSTAVGQLSRAAAADMYPPHRRGQAVGIVVAGGLVGGVVGPSLVTVGVRIAPRLGADPLAVPWIFVVAVFLIALLLLRQLRPDPRDIAQRLPEFYPGVRSVADASAAATGGRTVAETLSTKPAQAAIVAMACAQATMNMLMATAALMLKLHGHDTSTISLAFMAHIVGMFALSVPAGRLADRVGRVPVLVAGALLSASSGLMFTLGVHLAWVAAAAFYLVGFGWCLAFVAGAALLGDLSGPLTRARVLGMAEVISHGLAVIASLSSGILLARGGEITVGILAFTFGSAPLLAIFRATRSPSTGGPPLPVPVQGGK
jgi:MFS family permease